MELMKQQALNFGTRVVGEDIVEWLISAGDVQTLQPASGDPVEGRIRVIIATGARANYLGSSIGRRIQEQRRQCVCRL